MWGIDVTHTAHTSAQTGIQQVVRDLLTSFSAAGQALPVIHDHHWQAWRCPDARELGNLFPEDNFVPGKKRSSSWSRKQKFRGKWARRLGRRPDFPEISLLFCPELFEIQRDTALFSHAHPAGLKRVAYFYDAIPFLMPQWTPGKTVERYPGYLRALARFDHVTCISQASERDLQQSWEVLEVRNCPPTSVTPLGLPVSRIPREDPPVKTLNDLPTLLMVGTLEARKNHLSLLEACEKLWSSGLRFELRLAGMLNRETGEKVAHRIRDLQKRNLPVHWEGAVSNQRLGELYQEADLFVYPSLYEGFGIPVLEALAHGLPVVMTTNGALSELIEGGGCLACREEADGIAEALSGVLTNKILFADLAGSARARSIRSMRDAYVDLVALFQSLETSSSSLSK